MIDSLAFAASRDSALGDAAVNATNTRNRLFATLAFVAMVSLGAGISGCSEELGPERLPVTGVKGSVTEGTRRLSRGWIEFIPVEGAIGNLRSTSIRSDGTFDADGVAVGQNQIRLVNTDMDPGLVKVFGIFQSPIRRVVPAQPGEPLTINLLEEAVRYQTSLSQQIKSGPVSAGTSR
jgi:hypothetical protein